MTKTSTIVTMMALIFLASALPNPLAELVQKDVCAGDAMADLRPTIQAKISDIKQNSANLKAKIELLALLEQAKLVFEKCDLAKKAEPVLGDAVEAAGVGFLLASNCFKDVGAVLLIGDSVIQDPKDWENDVIVLIFVALLGRQGYADCAKFIGYVW